MIDEMEAFKELVALCKASVQISVNDHKDCYNSVEEYLAEEEKKDIEQEVLAEMVKRDTLVEVIAYPNTSISCFVAYHYDIDKAVEAVLDAVKKTR